MEESKRKMADAIESYTILVEPDMNSPIAALLQSICTGMVLTNIPTDCSNPESSLQFSTIMNTASERPVNLDNV